MSIDLAYAELGLSPGASESDVRAAWRRLASRWHPDRNGSASAVEFMQRINAAYERIRLSAFSRDGGKAAPARAHARRARPDASDREAAKRRTIRRKVRLSLEEAAFGGTRILRGKLTDTCGACAGHGVLPADAACPACAGAGSVRGTAWFGWASVHAPCKACAGRGVVRPPCSACDGKGRRSGTYRCRIRVPAGARQGDVLSAEGVGDLHAGFDGTLELHVEIAQHKLFTLGDDGILRCEMPVDGFAWLAGAWVEVPTLSGVQQMRLQRGRLAYRLRGQGMPLERRGTARGDFLVTVVPTFPEVLGERHQALLDELARLPADVDGPTAAAPMRAWRRRLQAWHRGRPKEAAAAG